MLDVPALPERGGDVLARGTELTPGGGFNVMAAAARQGLPVGYAGAHGTGPFGDLARAGLAAEGIEVLQPPRPDADTGFVVSMVDDGGERTFVTSPGAEATLTAADLAARGRRPGRRRLPVRLRAGPPGQPRGAARLAGPAARRRPRSCSTLARWSRSIPPDALAGVLAPGRLADLQRARGGAADRRGRPGRARCARSAERPPWPPRPGQRVLVRTGPEGCMLAYFQTPPIVVPGFPVTAVD